MKTIVSALTAPSVLGLVAPPASAFDAKFFWHPQDRWRFLLAEAARQTEYLGRAPWGLSIYQCVRDPRTQSLTLVGHPRCRALAPVGCARYLDRAPSSPAKKARRMRAIGFTGECRAAP
jgi:hypothetical protein